MTLVYVETFFYTLFQLSMAFIFVLKLFRGQIYRINTKDITALSRRNKLFGTYREEKW